MKTYISTFTEFDKYKKILKEGTASDTLVLFSETEDPMIPFSMFDLFKAAKCVVDITTYDSLGIAGLKKNEYLYFLMGKLTAEGKNVEILSANPILTNCKQILSKAGTSVKRKAAKATGVVKTTASKTKEKAEAVIEKAPKKASKAKASVKETSTKVATATKEKVSTAKTVVKEKTEAVKKATTKKKKSADDKKFDEQYDKLTAVVDGLKTDDFDPSTQIYNIVSAVKMMGEQKLTFEKAIKQVCSPLVADKLYSAIKSKKATIVSIIKEMPEDEK